MVDSGSSGNVAVAATATSVLPKRVGGKRLAYSISNYGAVVVYLTFSDFQTATSTTGLALQPGQTIADSNSAGYFCWQGAISAIEAGGAGTLSYTERVG